MHHAVYIYWREERSRCRMNIICAFVKEKAMASQLQQQKKQRAEFYLSKQATGAVDRLVVLGFSHQGPMAHI